MSWCAGGGGVVGIAKPMEVSFSLFLSVCSRNNGGTVPV